MSRDFWKTLDAFQREADALTMSCTKRCAQLRELQLLTAEVIAKSRVLMLKVDARMAADPWYRGSNPDS